MGVSMTVGDSAQNPTQKRLNNRPDLVKILAVSARLSLTTVGQFGRNTLTSVRERDRLFDVGRELTTSHRRQSCCMRGALSAEFTDRQGW
jgi:hypothetical protein